MLEVRFATCAKNSLMKLALHKARPIELYSSASSFSFPSGHPTGTTVVFGAIAVLISRRIGMRGKAAIFSIAAFWIFLVGLSRIYLSAHWPSDVIGGLLFGTALTAVFALLYDQLEQRKLRGTLIAVPVLSAFLIFGGYHAASAFHSNLSRYAHRTTTQKLELANWTDGAWHEVPASRIDLIGEEEEALSIQWAGTAKELTSALSKYDWKAATDFTWHDGLKLLSPGTQLKDLLRCPSFTEAKCQSSLWHKLGQGIRSVRGWFGDSGRPNLS
ncbi:MAG: phosphatase PAP2 family protein [Sphingomonadales bacterium]|nr:MAG: phosphatase PAP2 family protein [Sphingomonadales bacterium]